MSDAPSFYEVDRLCRYVDAYRNETSRLTLDLSHRERSVLTYILKRFTPSEQNDRRDKRIAELEAGLRTARLAIGDHNAPSDCYATGPLTGDPFRDLVQCPACSFIEMYDAALAKAEGTS